MARLIFELLSIFLLALGLYCQPLPPPTFRQTRNGPVEGTEQISSLGQKYYAFRGIPFAESPITGWDAYNGQQVDRRFKAPEALKRNWTRPLKLRRFAAMCMQPESWGGGLTPDEDCLYLNIYVPAYGPQRKTVMVWIHGGGFFYGSSSDHIFGPDFLLSQDVVVVTIQYRLGIFGFLNLDYGEYTGNMGLKDQQLALKWINENIEQFSGNRNEILIFGQSAGGVSVHHHMLNKESQKYFNRAFASSGSAFDNFGFAMENHVQYVQFSSKINGMNQMIEYLKTEKGHELIKWAKFWAESKYYTVWAPTIERADTTGAFFVKTPEEIYNSTDAPILDSMFCFMSQEWKPNPEYWSKISVPLINGDKIEPEVIPPFRYLSNEIHPKEYKKAMKKLEKAYFPDPSNIAAVERANIDLISDTYFNYGILKAVAFQSNANQNASRETGSKNTFLFRFNVTSDLNLWRYLDTIETEHAYSNSTRKFYDANHQADVCYMFHCHMLDQAKLYDTHLQTKDMYYNIIMRSVQMVTNFARTGNPSVNDDTLFRSCRSSDVMFCEEISNEPKSHTTYDIKKQLHYDVWHEIDAAYKNILSSPLHKPGKGGQSCIQFGLFSLHLWAPSLYFLYYSYA